MITTTRGLINALIGVASTAKRKHLCLVGGTIMDFLLLHVLFDTLQINTSVSAGVRVR